MGQRTARLAAALGQDTLFADRAFHYRFYQTLPVSRRATVWQSR